MNRNWHSLVWSGLMLMIGSLLYSCTPGMVVDKSETLIAIDSKPSKKKGLDIKFEFMLDAWNQARVQWEAPSSLVIRANGDYFIFASKVSTDRTTCSIFDCWDSRTVGVTVRYYEKNDGKKCTGAILHATDYSLTSVIATQEKSDLATRGTDNQLKQFASNVSCATLTRWVR